MAKEKSSEAGRSALAKAGVNGKPKEKKKKKESLLKRAGRVATSGKGGKAKIVGGDVGGQLGAISGGIGKRVIKSLIGGFPGKG